MQTHTYTIDDIIIVEFQGDLDNDFFSKMKPLIVEIVVSDYRKIILDMKAVEGVNKQCCDFLLKMNKIMKRYNRDLVIAQCSKKMKRIAEVTGIVHLYRLYDTLEEAKRHFQYELISE